MYSGLVALAEKLKEQVVSCAQIQSNFEVVLQPWQYNQRTQLENLRQRADLTVVRYGFPLYGCGRLKKLRSYPGDK